MEVMTTNGLSREQYNTAIAPLLSLPQEIRDMIYANLLEETNSVIFRGKAVYHTAPLSQVSQQLRREFYPLYLSQALKTASCIHIHITEFDCSGLRESLWEHYYDGVLYRRIGEKMHVHLTNEWKSENLRYFSRSCTPWDVFSPVENVRHVASIRFDSTSFEVEECRQRIKKMDWCLNRGNTDKKWTGVKKAFDRSFAEYDASASAKGGSKRKRKVKNTESRAMEKRVRRSQI